MPLAVLPFSVRQQLNIACDLSVPASRQGHPVPRWRGVTCRWGTAVLQLEDDRHPEVRLDFPVLALLPDRDPAGPRPEHSLLGAEFLTHYGFRVTFDYSAVHFLPSVTSRLPVPDPLAPCGTLELP
jgi:hypothetical protein